MNFRLCLPLLVMLASGWTISAKAQDDAEIIPPDRSQVEDLLAGTTFGGAEANALRPLDKVTIALIKDFEGWRAAHYDDPSMYCTIGYGHLIALQPCASITLGRFASPLSLAEGEDLLVRDTATARSAVSQLVTVDLSPGQYGALVSFIFNAGKENFRKSTMLKLVNAKAHAAVAQEFARWTKSKGKPLKGLRDRRACEAALYRGELALKSNGTIDRKDCQSFGGAETSLTLIDVDVGEQ